MNKIITIGISAIIAGSAALVSCSTSASDTAAVPMAADAKAETVTLALTGLQWAVACPPKVQSALSKVNGVSKATATQTSATVLIDRNKVTNAQLIKAVQGAGTEFDATIVR